jgi:hypothetical protein
MNNPPRSIAGLVMLCAALLFVASPAAAQPGGGGMQGPQFSGAMEKLFGEHKAFSASLDLQTDGGSPGKVITMAGRIAILNGMSRVEMDLTQMKGVDMPPEAMAQMKQMGMDKMVTVSAPDAKVMRMMYPSMKAYLEMPLPDSAATPASDYKMETTEIGSETEAGHPCVKSKVVVTGTDGVAHESTVWRAKDMDKFPVKIDLTESGNHMTMTFNDVKLEKPEASQFAAPTGYKKYDSMTSLIMSRVGGGQGAP